MSWKTLTLTGIFNRTHYGQLPDNSYLITSHYAMALSSLTHLTKGSIKEVTSIRIVTSTDRNQKIYLLKQRHYFKSSCILYKFILHFNRIPAAHWM